MKTEHKKVLVITYYWPPAGGSAIQRVVKLVKYMRNFGWEPIILTVSNGEYPVLDNSFESEIPEGLRIYRTPALQPFALYKHFTGKKVDSRITNDIFSQKNKNITDRIAKWIRMNLFIPDARIGWYLTAVREARKIIEQEQIEAIFSTSPPHSLQLIARKIARKYHLKWIADFRDPWTELVHNQTNKRSWLTRWVDGLLEQKVFRSADKVITVGKDVGRCIQSHVNREVVIIPNGYDAGDLIGSDTRKRDRFIITYTGELSKERLPVCFLQALKDVVSLYPNIQVQFIGNSCSELKNKVLELELDAFVCYRNYIPHKESVQELLASDVLLLVINRVANNKGILTGKIFEYLGCKKPILCIGPEDGDAAKIIKECDAGVTCDYDNKEKIKSSLLDLLEGGNNFQFHVEKYERREQAAQICELLTQLTEKG